MNEAPPDVLPLLGIVTLVSLVPFLVVTLTAFLKISVVMLLLRNALGIQQTPPNMVLYGIALMLTVYITGPVLAEVYARVSDPALRLRSIQDWQAVIQSAIEPVRAYLLRFTDPAERDFLLSATARVWPPEASAAATPNDMVILIPSFVISELTRAFEIGFLLYLPFIVIDLIVSAILMAMGMMMVSPLAISVPFKLFLFVMVDGWSRLLHGLILSYSS
jgi:type III secretion protein R